MPLVHILPVHGTFAQRARWIRADSPLMSFLRLGFSSSGYDVKVHDDFNWSGRNHLAARFTGARKLAQLIDSIPDDPSHKLVAIAHSHGGSVLAVLSRHFPAQARRIVASVCMATPWISARTEPDFLQLRAGMFGLALASLLPVATLLLTFPFFVEAGLARLIAFLLAVPVGLLPLFACVFIAKRLYLGGDRANDISQEVRAFSAAMDLGSVQIQDLLCIVPSSDEASALLKLAELLEWAIKMLARPFFLLGLAFSGKLLDTKIGITAAATLWFGLLLGAVQYEAAIVFWLAALGLGLLAAQFSLLLCSGLLFGVTHPAWRAYCRLSIDPIPLGRHDVLMVRSTSGALNHSAVYDDLDVHRAVFSHLRCMSCE